MKCPHCGTPIDEHEAGRETDVCVAVVVMGWLDVKMGRDDYGGQPIPEERNEFGELLIWKSVPEYSASDDIAAAWEVAQKMRDKRTWHIDDHITGWTVALWYDNSDVVIEANAALFQLAICRAALKAIHETQTAQP